ncbi:hypothetical protein K2173_027264 [Erythroxylum novogranatense]|uniref:Uncharacterized protein n=1 Tax=Erythroxylum novogranatense TaxID=1862640 RepID=A0AAV8TYG9_9ROSI|nr:hypothetical protein K2173_027264 [Erythroxylum novogranatense]
MGRSPGCDENGLKKGPWTPDEDQKLVDYIQKHGHGSWRALPQLAGLNRCGKSCRLRWTNYLRPDIKRGKFSQEEEQTILHLHSILGNKWSAIASHLTGRTDNEIKNFWNTHLKKKLIQMGFDPMTHQPRTDIFASLPHLIALANLKDLIENHPFDEQALRLQAEAMQLAKLQYLQCLLQSTTSINGTNSSPIGQNGVTDIEVLNTLNSISRTKESPVLNSSQLEYQGSYPLGNATSQPLNNHSLLSQVSNLEIPLNYQSPLTSDEVDLASSLTTLITHGDNHNNPSDSSLFIVSPTPIAIPQTITETSISNPGDASSSTSSYGGGNSYSYWPEIFFEDSIMHEIS